MAFQLGVLRANGAPVVEGVCLTNLGIWFGLFSSKYESVGVAVALEWENAKLNILEPKA